MPVLEKQYMDQKLLATQSGNFDVELEVVLCTSTLSLCRDTLLVQDKTETSRVRVKIERIL